MPNLGMISHEVTDTISQLPSAPTQGLGGTKELLTQLQRMLEDDPALEVKSKAEALEQVKVLAAAGRNPQAPGKQNDAKVAIQVLQDLMIEFPEAQNFKDACANLLPQVTEIFGLG